MNLEKLLQKGAGEYEKRGGDWFDDLLKKSRSYVEDQVGIDEDGVARGTRKATLDSLTKLEAHKADLLHLGSLGLIDLMAHIASGRTNEAVLAYLRETATLEELLAASEASDVNLLQRAAERKQAVKKALAVVGEIGALAARYVLAPLLQGLAAGMVGGAK